MTPADIAAVAFGGLGHRGAIVSLFIRATIADTIIKSLNGRYVGIGLCRERHDSLAAQLVKLEHQADNLTRKCRSGSIPYGRNCCRRKFPGTAFRMKVTSRIERHGTIVECLHSAVGGLPLISSFSASFRHSHGPKRIVKTLHLAYQFAHLLCMNLALVIDPTKKLKTSQAAPEVPLKP